MKVYKFYKKYDEGYDNIIRLSHGSIKDLHPLMGFTNSKKIRNRFKKERNIEEFYEEIVTKMDREEYKTFGNANANLLLKEITLVSKNVDIDGSYLSRPIKVLSNDYEFDFVESIFLEGQPVEYEVENLNPFIFKKEWRDILEKTSFMFNFRMFSGSKDRFLLLSYVDDDDIYPAGFESPDFVIDELLVFVTCFGYLYRYNEE